ncbi:hypothetical protein [Kutzneria sp. NPDC051319]|uniref:hypothetical protein n=1 Tax=Kutzneria sp. NPDC051319 TaxID=3155047 RepID=UPI00343C737C
MFDSPALQGDPWIAPACAIHADRGVHYSVKRKPDLLVALVERLPDERNDLSGPVVDGAVAGRLRGLLTERAFVADAPALGAGAR